MFEHLTPADYVACAIGVTALITFLFKKEGDKFELSEQDFKPGKYLKNNFFDFIFYIIGAFAMLIVGNEITEANPEFFEAVGMNPEGSYHWVISLGSGLIGAIVLERVLSLFTK